MRYALAVVFALCFLAGAAHADYLGEFDNGDAVTIWATLNDNGTVADSVGGDTLRCVIWGNGVRLDTIKLDDAGTTAPQSGVFFANWTIDTTGAGYGSYSAYIWAVNVGAGTRDPVGQATWTVFPRAALMTGYVDQVGTAGACLAAVVTSIEATVRTAIAEEVSDSVFTQGVDTCVGVGRVRKVVLADSVTGVRRVKGVVDSVKAVHRVNLSKAVTTCDLVTQVDTVVALRRLSPFGRAQLAAQVADSVNAASLSTLPAQAWYIGQYEQGESLTIGARLTGIDSAYATIYWRTEAIDTVELTSTAQGYYLRTMADTTGGGWGDWRALIRGYDSPSDKYVVNNWSLWDRHLYAQEVAESADVYIHDPDDSTVALVIRDSLNAWADSFKADTVVAVTNDTMHLNTADWGGLSARMADTVWTGGVNTRTLSASAYAEIGDSVGTSIAALDTIAYVANVGTVALTDSSGKVGTVTRSILNDSTIAAQRVREVVLPIDSVVAAARVWDVDSTRALATAWVLDSARIVASCDSVGKVDTVRAVARLTDLLEDSLRVVGRVTVVDSVTALARNWYTDSTRATWKVQQTLRADSTVSVGRMVNPLDSVVAVARVWDADSLRVARRALALTLADSVTGVRRLNGRVDSVTGVYRVARVDSAEAVGRLKGTVDRVTLVDSAASLFRARLVDSTAAVAIDSIPKIGIPYQVLGEITSAVRDTILGSRITGISWNPITLGAVLKSVSTDSLVGKWPRLAGIVADSVNAKGIDLVDSVGAVYRVRYVDLTDSSRVTAMTWDADSLRVAGRTILTDSTTNLYRGRIVDSTASQAAVTQVDSVRAVGIVWDVDSTRALDHARLVSEVSVTDSAVGVDRVRLTSVTSVATVVDSARVTRAVTGLTPATISAEVEAIKVSGVPWPTALEGIEADAQQAVDSLTVTEISDLAHKGDGMTLSGAEKASIADSFFYAELGVSYLYPTAGNILWNIQEDSLALPQTIAGMGADSTRALLAASALSDSIDALCARLGKAGGDTTVISLLRYLKANLNAVTFPTTAIAELTDSVWGAKLDSAGALRARWDSSTAAAHLWDASPKHHGQDFEVIDSTTKDTSSVAIGAFKASGVPVTGTEIYVYTLADSGWSQPVGEDLEPAADGRFFVPVYVPANGDTVYYRVRFHAPGYLDQTKIVRFPQP